LFSSRDPFNNNFKYKNQTHSLFVSEIVSSIMCYFTPDTLVYPQYSIDLSLLISVKIFSKDMNQLLFREIFKLDCGNIKWLCHYQITWSLYLLCVIQGRILEVILYDIYEAVHMVYMYE